MLRRLQLQAWSSSHADTEMVRSLGPAFAAQTVEVAERYLSAALLDRASSSCPSGRWSTAGRTSPAGPAGSGGSSRRGSAARARTGSATARRRPSGSRSTACRPTRARRCTCVICSVTKLRRSWSAGGHRGRIAQHRRADLAELPDRLRLLVVVRHLPDPVDVRDRGQHDPGTRPAAEEQRERRLDRSCVKLVDGGHLADGRGAGVVGADEHGDDVGLLPDRQRPSAPYRSIAWAPTSASLYEWPARPRFERQQALVQAVGDGIAAGRVGDARAVA